MKVSELTGKKVLDINAYDIGKIQDIDVDLKKNMINKVILSPNEITLKKVSMEIEPETISEVGDYILLNISKSKIAPDDTANEVPDVEIVDPDKLEKRS